MAAALLNLKARLATIAAGSYASALSFVIENTRKTKLTTCVDDSDAVHAEAFVATCGTTPVAVGALPRSFVRDLGVHGE